MIKRWKGKWQSKWFKACKSGKTKFVQLLLAVLELCKSEEIDLNVRDKGRMTGFMWACQDGIKHIARGYLGRTGLMIACDYGYKHVVKLLLECSDPRFDLNAKDRMGWTALMLACKSGHEDVVKLLLEDSDRRIDLNARDRWG